MKSVNVWYMNSNIPEQSILRNNINDTVIICDSTNDNPISYPDIKSLAFCWVNTSLPNANNQARFPLFFDKSTIPEQLTDPTNLPLTDPVSDRDKYNRNRHVHKSIPDIVKQYPNLQFVDLITCNLSETGIWATAFADLRACLPSGADIRYSTNITGPVAIGGDWILENGGTGNTNISNIYFKDTPFQYNHTLDTDTQTPTEFKNNYPRNVYIKNNIIRLRGNIVINPVTWKTVLIPENITKIYGRKCNIDIKSDNIINDLTCASIFRKVSDTSELEIKNIKIDGQPNVVFDGLVFSDSSNSVTNIIVSYCSVTDVKIPSEKGAIYGPCAGSGIGKTAIAIKCYSTIGATNSNDFGGIFGSEAGFDGGTAYASACHSTISATECNFLGGIFGWYAGAEGGTATASACYSTISANKCDYFGGIFADDAGYYGGKAEASACYSTISATTCNDFGGIFGWFAGDEGTATASSCYSTIGATTCDYFGGIFGSYAGYNGTATVSACYSTIGANTCDYFGGIFGSSAGYYSELVTASACYSTINATTCNYFGGIFGEYAGVFSGGTATALACYSTIGATECNYFGGIFGAYAGYTEGTAYALACYSTIGATTCNGFGGIFGSYAGGDNGTAYALACYSIIHATTCNDIGGIFGADYENITAEECYYLILLNNVGIWVKYGTNDNPIIPDSELFIYNVTRPLKEQLELIHFYTLPWSCIHITPQKPFLLDWTSLPNSHFCDYYKYYISYDIGTTINTLDDLKAILKVYNARVKSPPKNLFRLKFDQIKKNDRLYLTELGTYISVYKKYTTNRGIQKIEYFGTNGLETVLFTPDIYKISRQFFIPAEFILNKDLVNPFILFFKNVIGYNIAKIRYNYTPLT